VVDQLAAALLIANVRVEHPRPGRAARQEEAQLSAGTGNTAVDAGGRGPGDGDFVVRIYCLAAPTILLILLRIVPVPS
jgi:hypothetical protein